MTILTLIIERKIKRLITLNRFLSIMIITISGQPGSGKTTIAKKIATKLDFPIFSIGDIWDQLAAEKNMSILELQKLAEEDQTIDREVDKKQREIAKRYDNLVLDSRLGFMFVPQSVKILLIVNSEIAAKRVFGDRHNRESEKENINLKETAAGMKERRDIEIRRYIKYYDVNVDDKNNFDLVIDTSSKDVEEILSVILDYIEKSL